MMHSKNILDYYIFSDLYAMDVSDLCVDLTEEKQTKPRKSKRLMMPPKRIVPIKNRDKIGSEVWNPERAKDIGNFPSPSRILLLGSCGVGKSNLIKNLIIHQRPRFQEVYLIHEDAGATKEYKDLECTAELDEVPDLDFWDRPGPHIKRAVIIDDLEITSATKQRLKNLCVLMRYASTHKGLTVYFGHQSFWAVPTLVRRMCSVFILWKPRARTEAGLIEDRTGMPKGSLTELFNTVATGHYDSICIDLTNNSPAVLRLNVWQPIEGQEQEEHDNK